MSDDYRLNKINDILTGPGYILSSEILDEMKQQQTKWAIAVAEYDLNDYQPDIHPTDAQIEEYYDDNSFRYATPARRIISYAELKDGDYQDLVEVDDEKLQAYFDANGANYEKPAPVPVAPEGAPTETPPAATIPALFEDVKDQVAMDYRAEQAKIIEGGNQIASNLLIYDIAEQRINAQSAADGRDKVQITYTPKEPADDAGSTPDAEDPPPGETRR